MRTRPWSRPTTPRSSSIARTRASSSPCSGTLPSGTSRHAEPDGATGVDETSCSSHSSTRCRPGVRGSASQLPTARRDPGAGAARCAPPLLQRLALFERCSYRYYAERVLGLPPREVPQWRAATRWAGSPRRRSAMRSIDCSSSSRSTSRSSRREKSSTGRSQVVPGRLGGGARTGRLLVEAYCESALAKRVAELRGAQPERPFAFEHDGVVIRGRLDVLWREGDARSSSTTSRTRSRGDRRPRSSSPSTRSSGSCMHSCVSAQVRPRSRSRTSSSSAATTSCRRRSRRRHPGARGRALGGDRADPRRRVPADAERVRVLGLPGARPRLRRTAARALAVASRGARRRDQRHPRQSSGARGGARGGRGRAGRRGRRRRRHDLGPWAAEVSDLLGRHRRDLSFAATPIARSSSGATASGSSRRGRRPARRRRGLRPRRVAADCELAVDGLGARARLPLDADLERADLHADHAGHGARSSCSDAVDADVVRLRPHAHAVRPHARDRAARRESRQRRACRTRVRAAPTGRSSGRTSSSGGPSTTSRRASRPSR